MPGENYQDPLLASPVSLRSDDVVVFVVYKQGKFGQGIHGIHTNQDYAISLAKEAAARDIDDYHNYDVYPVPMGRLPERNEDPMADYGWMNLEPVFSVSKSEAKKASDAA